MIPRTFPSAKTLTLAGLGALACLSLALSSFAASEEKATDEIVATPSAIIKWDRSAQAMTSVDAQQAAQIMEQVRAQMNERFIATGRITAAEDMKVETTPSGLKRLRATVDMMNFAVVRVGEDGQLVQSCAKDPEASSEAASFETVASNTAKGDR